MIYANGHWMRSVTDRVLSHLETTNSKKLSAKMVPEINFASGCSLAQHPGWLNSKWILKDCRFRSVIIFFPGKAVVLGTTVVNFFNCHCCIDDSRPSTSRFTQCLICKGFGHRRERWELPAKCSGYAAAHITEFHTCTTSGGIMCDHTLMRCANCPTANY